MSVIIGIDIGGSTTKIVGFQKTEEGKRLLSPFLVSAADPITSMYGAFGKFLSENSLPANSHSASVGKRNGIPVMLSNLRINSWQSFQLI